MRDMHSSYYNMATHELLTLRSKKMLRCAAIRRKRMGYFDQQELRKLETQIRWIEAVIAARRDQMPLEL